MLQQLRSFYSADNSTVPMKNYNQYIKELSNKSKSYISKYDESTKYSQSLFTRTIKRLLIKYDIEVSEIEKQRDNFDLIDLVNNLITNNSPPDQHSFLDRGVVYEDNNSFTVNEYFLLFKNRIPFKYFPMRKELSTSVFPVRLMYSDSNEYSLHVVGSRLVNKFDYPDIAIFSIDVSLLLFIYFKYTRLRIANKEEINTEEFIREYVFLPLIYQQQDIIFINMIQSIIEEIEFSIITETDIHITGDLDITYDNRFNFVNYNLKKALSDFGEIIPKLVSGKTTPVQILNSIKLPSGISLKENMILNDNLIKLTNDIKQEWTIFLKDFHHVKLICFLYNAYPNDQNKKAIRRLLYSKINILKSTKFWNYIPNKELRDYIKNNLIYQIDQIVST